MPRFLVEHRHTADTCPAGNPEAARALAGHVTPATAATYGVKLLAEAVVEGQHTVVMIVEADRPEAVEAFAAPFGQVGTVTVKPAVTCDIVAGRAHD